MKIDTEVAGLKTMLESHKLDTIKYLAGWLQSLCAVMQRFSTSTFIKCLFNGWNKLGKGLNVLIYIYSKICGDLIALIL